MRRIAFALAIAGVGFLAGAGVTLAVQRGETAPRLPSALGGGTPPTALSAPGTFLAWTPGGLPEGFRQRLASLAGIHRAVVVKSDVAWLTGSYSSGGDVVDDPPSGLAIPLEVAAVHPLEYAPFVPPADRGVVADLANGFGVLGESSARLRGLDAGAILVFGDVRVQIAAIWPDELVGAHELLVDRALGRSIGVTRDRYALLQPEGEPTERRLAKLLRSALPAGVPVQVRSPGETPYFREGDAVLPPVELKLLFGEFAARPAPGRPGYLEIDPAWEAEHIATEHVPLLGRVTCNVAIFPQLRGATSELLELGLGGAVETYDGCYARRFVNRDPEQAISHHTWGVAIDLNVGRSPFGRPPDQDPRMVEVFERWGFIWGGTFVRPDGMHFEYHRPPAEP